MGSIQLLIILQTHCIHIGGSTAEKPHDVGMAGEHQDLAMAGKIGRGKGSLLPPLVIEMHQNLVCDDGKAFAYARRHLQKRDTQGRVELLEGSQGKLRRLAAHARAIA